MAGEDNGWNEWSKYVLKELESLNTKCDAVQKSIHQLRVEIATLKAKAAAWSAVAAIVVSGVVGLGIRAMGA